MNLIALRPIFFKIDCGGRAWEANIAQNTIGNLQNAVTTALVLYIIAIEGFCYNVKDITYSVFADKG